MRSSSAILAFVLAINHSLAVEWTDSGIKISNAQVSNIQSELKAMVGELIHEVK